MGRPAPQLEAHLAFTHVDLTYWINNAKANAAGRVPISLRITVHGTRAEASTGIRCLPAHWDKVHKRLLPASRKDEATHKLNAYLENFIASARLLGTTLKPLDGQTTITAAQVRTALLPARAAPPPCCWGLLQKASTRHQNLNSRAGDATALKAFDQFLGQPPPKGPRLPSIPPELASRFVQWLSTQGRENATSTYLRRLSALYTLASLPDPNPFSAPSHRVRVPQPRPRYVPTKAELARLVALDLPEGLLAWSRDLYLCQYYLHGSRLGPVLELSWAQVDWQGGRVKYRAEKRGGWHDVALRPALAAVLRRYCPKAAGLVFPVLPANYFALPEDQRHRARKTGIMQVWRGLKKLGEMLDLPGRLHSHTARHALATHTVEATGSIRAAQGMLGHKSEATTERYVRALQGQQLDAVADSVYD